MIGQIATYMETLHLSYKEVTTMSYRMLVVMAIDKLGIDNREKKVVYGSARQELERRRQAERV